MPSKERYYRLKAQGICVSCGQRPAFGHYTLCEVCLERDALWRIAHTDRVSQTKEYKRQAAKKFADARKAAGRCVRCGRPAVDGQTQCAWCAARNRERVKQYNRNRRNSYGEPGELFRDRIAAGACMYCGRPAVEGYAFCPDHLAAKQEHGRWLSKTYNGFRKANDEYGKLTAAKKGEHR